MKVSDLLAAVACGPVMIAHHIQGRLGPIVRAERSPALTRCVTVEVHSPHRWLCCINPIGWRFEERKERET